MATNKLVVLQLALAFFFLCPNEEKNLEPLDNMMC